MKKMFSGLLGFIGCFVLLVLPTFVLASTGVPVDPDMPAWLYKLLGAAAGVITVITQVDAQISEEFKMKWPWWLRLIWNFAAGNYKHSKNIGSE